MYNSTLDKYDYLIIRNCKSAKGSNINILKRIFAKRCAVDLEYVSRKAILDHLIDLIEYLNITTFASFIGRLTNVSEYDYYHHADKSDDIIARCINLCCAEIRLCTISNNTKMENYPSPLKFRIMMCKNKGNKNEKD